MALYGEKINKMALYGEKENPEREIKKDHSVALSIWVYIVIAVALLVILYVIANGDPEYLSHHVLIKSIQDD